MCLNFFIKIKKKHMRRKALTPRHKIVVYAIWLIFTLNIILSLNVSVLWSLYQSSLFQNDPALLNRIWVRIVMQPVTWILNFVTLLGLLALFHHQGVKEAR